MVLLSYLEISWCQLGTDRKWTAPCPERSCAAFSAQKYKEISKQWHLGGFLHSFQSKNNCILDALDRLTSDLQWSNFYLSWMRITLFSYVTLYTLVWLNGSILMMNLIHPAEALMLNNGNCSYTLWPLCQSSKPKVEQFSLSNNRYNTSDVRKESEIKAFADNPVLLHRKSVGSWSKLHDCIGLRVFVSSRRMLS